MRCTNVLACYFMGNIFVSGGNLRYEITSSCFKSNQADCTWIEVAEMKDARSFPSCTVFEGKKLWFSEDRAVNLLVKVVEISLEL